ncbi:MAG: helical backbone metal receptor [Myxococcales bacterium]|nr:ABC transporter substrate-binding protein [Myxococcales bacterium]HIK85802.1 ABC transporter substrate-binding protein [Myxococcales bacterium]
MAEGEDLLAHQRVHLEFGSLAGGEFERIISLVPSLSEALVVLGLGDRLVGVTEYCVHPREAFCEIPKLGGTKDSDADAIIALAPDLVIANHEENTERVVRQLANAGIEIWLTYPRTVREGVVLFRELAELGATSSAIERIVVPVEQALKEAAERQVRRWTEAGGPHEPALSPRPRVFCPIWRDPWMTISGDTYIHDLIELCGGENLFAGTAPKASVQPVSGEAAAGSLVRGSENSGRRDRRYPIVDLEEVAALSPDVILLPDEPYAFAQADVRELAGLDCPAARDSRIHLIDGTLVSWYGPRITEAIRVLAGIFANS